MIAAFGTLHDGRVVEAITLGHHDGLQAQLLTYGGLLRGLTLPAQGSRRNLVLTLPDLNAYVRDPAYLGVVVGRFANRIANAQFTLNDNRYRLTANEGTNQRHGGVLGFGKRLWRVVDYQTSPQQRLLLGLHSPAGEEGYPGNLDVTLEFTVEAQQLQLIFEARCDQATPLNLTYHPYFNLAGDPQRSAAEQLLRISASGYLPVRDSQRIPTGEIAGVADTPFDFRNLRSPGAAQPGSHPQLFNGGGYDHCWVLDAQRDCDAELCSPHSGITMQVQSTQPGLQFYGGQYLSKQYPGWTAVCLEPQSFPNAVNEPCFPAAILQPGETYRSVFRYRFSTT